MRYYGLIATDECENVVVLVIREDGRQVSQEPTGVTFDNDDDALDYIGVMNRKVAAEMGISPRTVTDEPDELVACFD